MIPGVTALHVEFVACGIGLGDHVIVPLMTKCHRLWSVCGWELYPSLMIFNR
jgi:hypothetical protein